MEQAVIEQRENLDQLVKLIRKMRETEEKIIDKQFRTDMLVVIGQHRHSFEEQNVVSHDKCVSFQVYGGSFDGITGGLMLLCDREPYFRDMILETTNYIILKMIQ